MNKKGAIGLSINVLVIIIISLVVLGLGISMLYGFIGGAKKIKGQLDSRTDSELERLLTDQGQQVALPLHTTSIFRGDSHVFGLGILNINSETTTSDFTIEVELSRAIVENEEITTENLAERSVEWIVFNDEKITLAENEHKKEPILIEIPTDAPQAEYIFNVRVYLDDEQYGNTQKFYVKAQ